MARGHRPVAPGLLNTSARARPLRSTWSFLLVLASAAAGCVADRAPESGAPATVPAVLGGVAGGGSSPAGDSSGSDASTARTASVETGDAAGAAPGAGGPADGAASAPAAPAELLPDDGSRPTFVRPDNVRALYLNAWAAGSTKRVGQLIDLARRTEVNAFVIDIKDASGYVSHHTDVALAREIGATGQPRIPDLRGLLRRLSSEGIYPIARIVIVRDPVLAAGRPALAVQSEAGTPWHDEKGIVWMNIAQRGVWDYNVDLAEEVARMGFPEIQWDYVRFPDAPRAVMARARFPGLDGPKSNAVRSFLDYANHRLDALDLGVVHTADVFGITTSTQDVGIGQIWERFIDEIDVALPMVYPSHYYRGSFGYQSPNAYPYEVVRRALERALERSKAVAGAGRVRPYLQDFNLGPPAYGAAEVRAQIQAAYDVGIEEWVLWNAGSRYTEAALRPESGWKEEPRIRVADRIVPVSRRFDLIKTANAKPSETAPRAEPVAPPEPTAAEKTVEKSTEPTGGTPATSTPRPSAPPDEPNPRRRVDESSGGDRGQPRVWKPDALRRHIDSISRSRDTVRNRER